MERFSEFDSSLQPLDAGPLLGGAAVQWKDLGLVMEQQQQTEWCWSAVATSVSRFYNAGSAWIQCSVVNAELGETTCCKNGSSAACNRPWYLDKALTRTNNLIRWVNGSVAFNAVQAQVNNTRAVGARIGWSGGGGHFVVLDGYSNTNMVSVEDPWYGHSTYDYATFTTAYQGSGTWTHTYETRP